MPKWYGDYGRGYDLDSEHNFFEADDGTRYILGSSGSFIMVCPVCGSEAFRDRPGNEICIPHPKHGMKVPLTFDNVSQFDKLWVASGSRIITAAERRASRLADEAEDKRGGWKYGTNTEADYPHGYVRASIKGKT